MSKHTDRIRDSGAVSNLRECVDLLRALSQVDWETEETQDLIARLTAVTENVLGRLTVADRNLVPIDAVDVLESRSQWILEIVTSLKDSAPSGDISLPDAGKHIDALLAAASVLPVLPIHMTSEVLEKAARQFDQEARSARVEITAFVNSLRQQIRSTFDDSNRNLAEVKSTTKSLNARINDATEQLQREVTDIQEVFRISQKQRDTEFTADQANRDREFHKSLDSTIEDIKRFRDEANKMLEEVAGAGTAAHYVGHSQQQSKTADRWRRIGVGALLILALASIGVLFMSSQTEQGFSVTWLIARTGVLGFHTCICRLRITTVRQTSTAGRDHEALSKRTSATLAFHESATQRTQGSASLGNHSFVL